MLKTKNQTHLRVVTREGRFAVPRRYAQSTSGRISSMGTAPSLSRESEMAKPSRTRSPVDSTFLKYPTLVSQRSAYDSCCSGLSEFKNARREGYLDLDSIPRTLPLGNVVSIPTGNLPAGNAGYDGGVTESTPLQDRIYAARRVRLGELIDAYDGPTTFVVEIETRLRRYPDLRDNLTSFVDTSYLSRASGRVKDPKNWKNIGDIPAMALELLFEKEQGWMSGDAFENFITYMNRRRKAAS